MKRYKHVFLATLLTGMCTFGAQSWAEGSDGYGTDFADKLSHGLNNMAFGFMELPKNVVNISNDSNILLGVTWGSLRGAFHGVTRTLVGAADFLTFPFPTADYVSPGYPWERFSEDTRYFGRAYPFQWTTLGPLDDGDELRLQ